MTLDVHPILDALAHARSNEGSVTASTMTFVVFFEDASVGGWLRDRTRAVADKHPSRVVVLDGTAGADTTRALPSPARGEWVELGVKGCSEHDLAVALSHLALADAPLVLNWIASDLAGDARLACLAKMATTVVVSSSVLRPDGSGLADLCAFMGAHPEVVAQDVAYLRLTAWQELVAEFFDDPQALEELHAIASIEVGAGSDSEMYYFLAWLAGRLGWQPSGDNAFIAPGGARVGYTMVREGPPRRLSRVTIVTPTASFTACVHPDDDAAVTLHILRNGHESNRVAPMHTVDIASLVERAILAHSRDVVFVETLAIAKSLLEHHHA